MKKVIGLGAGGHAAVVVETMRVERRWKVVGLLDRTGNSDCVLGVPVVGSDDEVETQVRRRIKHFFLGVGMMGSAVVRRELVDKVVRAGGTIVGTVHPEAHVAASVKIEQAPQVFAGAIVQSRTRLGRHVIVNSGAIVEHDSIVGDFSHIASGACLAGGVRVGRDAFVGMRSSVRQGIRIGDGAFVAAGAVVVRDVPDGEAVAGIPARLMQSSIDRAESPANPESGES